MTFPRVNAAVFVLLLIACFTLLGVGSVFVGGPLLTHSGTAAHDAGIIKTIDPRDMSFTLLTADHKLVHFQCSDRCHSALSHMLRHEMEKAHTDVYFVEMGDIFIALDVD